MLRARICILIVAGGLASCKHDAVVKGTVTQAGKGVPGVSVALSCPDGPRQVTTTNATGDFRFEDLGPGVDDRCMVEASSAGTWIAPLAIGSRCGQHDAAGLCTEALYAFQSR